MATSLSGGNQPKLVIARWLAADGRLRCNKSIPVKKKQLTPHFGLIPSGPVF